jgi:hypothetical protein
MTVTLPLNCPYCGQSMAVKCIQNPAGSALCQCPYFGCRKTWTIGGFEKVVAVVAVYRDLPTNR